METKTQARAEFDKSYSRYTFWSLLLFFFITIGGIALLPFWFLGWGQWYSRRSREELSCELTNKSLNIKRGIIFRKEKNIPLDKITDITLTQGPLMRAFGVHKLIVETAGQGQNGNAEGALVGIVDATGFRQTVLSERDKFAHAGKTESGGKTLDDIYALLEKIEKKLGN